MLVAGAFLCRWALSGGAASSADVRTNLARPSIEAGRVVGTDPSKQKTLARLLGSLTHGAGGQFLKGLGLRMTKAGVGGHWTIARMVAVKVLVALVVLLPGLMWFVASLNVLVLIGACILSVLMFFYPDVRLSSMAKERMQEVENQLPDILDRLIISMDAGLGFETALAKVVQGRPGAGYVEFRRVQQDLQLGFPRDLALSAMSQRLPIPDLRLVLDSILQSGKYGLSLSSVLRMQSEELRDRRKMRAQERAMKVPVKILLPLILCILPALFVVLVGPAVMKLAKAFS
jgi:tight adherence protein C